MNQSDQPPANVTWSEKGQPISREYGDMYFSIADGLAESRYVFIEQNQLPIRFSNLKANEHFIVGETGFGTGLNFLSTWQCWLEHAPCDAQLHFISTEKYPLSYHELSQALRLWPQLTTLAERLLAEYKIQFIGTNESHYYHFTFGNVHLSLLIDDVSRALQQLLPQQHNDFMQAHWAGVDAWFLDGFSPAKNPDMWTDELLHTISFLSKAGTSLSTYTAASSVKRVLENHNFIVDKKPGFGKKRELITAKINGQPICKPYAFHKKNQTPWAYNENLTKDHHSLKANNTVAIIGGGLAGCHTAYALAKQGFKVTIFEANSQLASEGSGNPQAMLYTKLSANKEPLAEFNLACQLYAQTFYQKFWETTDHQSDGEQCGLLQLAYNQSSEKKQRLLAERFRYAHFLKAISKDAASKIAAISVDQSGIYLPCSGWINPVSLCGWLTQDENIIVRTDTLVNSIKAAPDQQWQLQIDNHQQQSFGAVVICNAHTAKEFSQTAWLPTKALRGQISYIDSKSPLLNIQTVITGENYIAPATKSTNKTHSFHSIGASYDLKNAHKEVTPEEHEQNLNQLNQLIPVTKTTPTVIKGGRANLRCTSPDYLPLVGNLPNHTEFIKNFSPLSQAARTTIEHSGEYLPRLFLNTGHGSRGLAYTPLAAQIIASQLTGTPPPLPQTLVDALNPARFIIRGIKRKPKHKL